MMITKGVKWNANTGALDSIMKYMPVQRSSVSGTAYTVTRTAPISWAPTLTTPTSCPLVTVPMLLKGAADILTMHPIMLAMPQWMFPTHHMVLLTPLPITSDHILTTGHMATPYIIEVKYPPTQGTGFTLQGLVDGKHPLILGGHTAHPK